MLTIKPVSLVMLALPLVLLAGCPNNTTDDHPDQVVDAGGGTPDATSQPVVVTPKDPIGAACSANADCGSGFCTDGVCCDSACDQTCYACNQQGTMGHCAALTSGEDPMATTVCIAPSACFLPASTNVPACKLVDGTACQADGDCVSGHCLTYYADRDGDGYGGSDAGHFCAELNAPPPAGYAAYTGDCCDLDSGANPGFDSTQFLSMPDACGSYDWNCNGVITMEKACSTDAATGQSTGCGQACSLNLGPYGTLTLFTVACN
jgi:hypothetical protein